MSVKKIKSSNKLISRSFLALSNAGRGLSVGLFGLVLNYLLVHFNSLTVLNTYVYFITSANLFLTFTNWGGKFYNSKGISKNPKNSRVLISDLISSKFILLFVSIIVTFFINIEFKLKLLLILYLFLKSFSSIFDSLILFQKKSGWVFISESILFSLFLLLNFLFSSKLDSFTFIIGFVFFECVKFLYYLVLLRTEIRFHFSIEKGYQTLINSFYFFAVALAGFIVSKSDLYIVGIQINKEAMSQYFIISSLSSLSMVVYSTSVNTFVNSFYRFNPKQFKKLGAFLMVVGFLFSVFSSIAAFLIINLFYKISIDGAFGILMFLNCFIFTLLHYEMYRFTKLEKQKTILIFLIVSGFMNCVFSFLFIKQLLLLGAFLANTLGILINYLLFKIYLIKKKIDYES